MIFLDAIETLYYCQRKRFFYQKFILLTMGALIALSTLEFSTFGTKGNPRELVDFDDFYIVGQLVWHHEIDKAYHFLTMSKVQESLSHHEAFLPWTYPPQFDLVVASLDLFPTGVAYGLFILGSFAAYVLTLRRIAAEGFILILIVTFPALVVTIRCGQNGFLTGTLIGLTCFYLQCGKSLAGLPLGLMIIKPHLAIAFALYTVVNHRWKVALAAIGTVVGTTIASTLILGIQVWDAFLSGAREASIFLTHGFYPLFRMVSVYACVKTVGLPTSLALLVQAVVAIIVLSLVVIASLRFSRRQALGITAIASLLISPYAYDYDLPILGVGLTLLLPDLILFGSELQRLILYILTFFTCGFGLATAFSLGHQTTTKILGEDPALSLAGPALVLILGFSWRILQSAQMSDHANDHEQSIPTIDRKIFVS